MATEQARRSGALPERVHLGQPCTSQRSTLHTEFFRLKAEEYDYMREISRPLNAESMDGCHRLYLKTDDDGRKMTGSKQLSLRESTYQRRHGQNVLQQVRCNVALPYKSRGIRFSSVSVPTFCFDNPSSLLVTPLPNAKPLQEPSGGTSATSSRPLASPSTNFESSSNCPIIMAAAHPQAFIPAGPHTDIPTLHTQYNWLELLDAAQAYPQAQGYWILRYSPQTIDQRWAELCGLYANGGLPGVSHISVSTLRYNHTHPGCNDHVILIKCGPSEDEAGCKEILQGVLEHLPVENHPCTLHYNGPAGTTWHYLVR